MEKASSHGLSINAIFVVRITTEHCRSQKGEGAGVTAWRLIKLKV